MMSSATADGCETATECEPLTSTVEFPGRSHFTLGQPGWEAVVDFALSWSCYIRSMAIRTISVRSPSNSDSFVLII